MARNYYIFRTPHDAVGFSKDVASFVNNSVQEGCTIIRNETSSMVLAENDAAIMIRSMPETDPEVLALSTAIRRHHNGFRWTVNIETCITLTKNGYIVTAECWLVQKDPEDRVCKKVCQVKSRVETELPRKNALP